MGRGLSYLSAQTHLCWPLWSHVHFMFQLLVFYEYYWWLQWFCVVASSLFESWGCYYLTALTFLEVQMPYQLKSFVTNNGKLASLSIHDWCSCKSIQHLFTAPYTSAHNGQVKWLHHTLLDKACTMKSACNTPINMWDEFCATSAYLTNLTGASVNQGKTPYKKSVAALLCLFLLTIQNSTPIHYLVSSLNMPRTSKHTHRCHAWFDSHGNSAKCCLYVDHFEDGPASHLETPKATGLHHRLWIWVNLIHKGGKLPHWREQHSQCLYDV